MTIRSLRDVEKPIISPFNRSLPISLIVSYVEFLGCEVRRLNRQCPNNLALGPEQIFLHPRGFFLGFTSKLEKIKDQ